MPRYWVTWVQPLNEAGDYRPSEWPLPAAIPGYWLLGRQRGGRVALCAVVDAASAAAARREVHRLWTPEGGRVEVDEKPSGWRPDARRFAWPERETNERRESR